MPTEFFAEGSDVAIGTGANVTTPGTWTSVGCVMSVTPPKPTMSFRAVKPCLKVVAPRVVKQKPSTFTYGTYEVTLRFDADFYDTNMAILQAGTLKPLACKLGDTTKAQVANVYIQSLGVENLTDEGEVMIDVSFLVSDGLASVAASTIAAFS